MVCNIHGSPIKINHLIDSHAGNVWGLGLWFKFPMMFGDSCNESPKREKACGTCSPLGRESPKALAREVLESEKP